MQALDINRVDPARSLPDLHRIRPLIVSRTIDGSRLLEGYLPGVKFSAYLCIIAHSQHKV